MLLVQSTDGKRSRAAAGGSTRHFRTLGRRNRRVNWRATADEDGHYCFAVAL